MTQRTQHLFVALTALPAALVAPAELQDIAHDDFPYRVVHARGAERLAQRVVRIARELPPLPGLEAEHWQRERIEIVLAPDEQSFRNWSGGTPPEWGAGIAIPSRSRIVLPAYGSTARGGPLDYRQVLRHELAHIALHRAAPGHVPRWFNEGYATWAAGQLDWENAWQLRAAFVTGRAPPLDSLDLEWPRLTADARIAYLLSASFVEFLVRESGIAGLERLFEQWRSTPDFNRALQGTYGADLGQLESQWRAYVKRHYGWAVLLSQSVVFATMVGALVITLIIVRRRRDRRKFTQLLTTEPPDHPAFWQEGGVEIIAHRGYSARAPENTLAAMELALNSGASALEFDIRTSRDGVPFVIHDPTLERTTNGQGRVADKTADELKRLDAGRWFSIDFTGEPLPTLADLLAEFGARANRLYIELKPGAFTQSQLRTVVDLLAEHGCTGRSVLMSFDWQLLDWLREMRPDLRLAFLADDEPAFLQAVARAAAQPDALVDCNYRVLLEQPALAEQALAGELELAVYTVNDTSTAVRLFDLGVSHLTTNEVEKLLRWARGVG